MFDKSTRSKQVCQLLLSLIVVLTEKYKGICDKNASEKEQASGRIHRTSILEIKKIGFSRYSLSKSKEYKEASLLSEHMNTLYSLLNCIAVQDLYMFVSL